ncbi:MAG: cytochrome c [Chloroflexota bacterium]
MNLHTHPKYGRWWLFAALALLTAAGLLMALASPGSASSLEQSAQEGEQLFQKNCAACHTIGGGNLVGPDLQGVTQRRERAWLEKMIIQPDKLLASDKTAQELLQTYKLAMPNLGITQAQAQAILAYLENPGAGGQAAAPILLSGGSAEAGKALFSGETAFANGGTPCIACHSAAGINAIGGGSLGPDLTHVYQRLGEAGLSSALVGLPFPTMQGIFVNAPLTAQEQADLFAYFQQTDQQAVQTSALNANIVWGLGAAGALILFGVMLVFWPRQRESISARLRRTARTG